MKKSILIMVLLTAVLFSACSQGKTNVTENTKETVAAVADVTEEPTESYLYATEEETAVIPTVPDDVDYYEMYQEESHDKRDSVGGYLTGSQYAKEWVSTDGRISFTLDTRCGPFARTFPEATYTVDDEVYQTHADFNVMSSPYLEIEIETDNHYTIVLSGPFDYDHDEQSFTVRSDNDVLTVPDGYDMDKLKEEFNEEYGDPDIPYYHADEKVTFKMVR